MVARLDVHFLDPSRHDQDDDYQQNHAAKTVVHHSLPPSLWSKSRTGSRETSGSERSRRNPGSSGNGGSIRVRSSLPLKKRSRASPTDRWHSRCPWRRGASPMNRALELLGRRKTVVLTTYRRDGRRSPRRSASPPRATGPSSAPGTPPGKRSACGAIPTSRSPPPRRSAGRSESRSTRGARRLEGEGRGHREDGARPQPSGVPGTRRPLPGPGDVSQDGPLRAGPGRNGHHALKPPGTVRGP
jgi:hypothetical protein